METDLPQFDAPPVVEVVLGVQFAPLSGFTTAHAGCFWSALGSSEWTRTEEVPALDDAFERFGEERVWERPGIRLTPGVQPNRIQLINKDDDHMLQVQPSRFVLNWRRRAEEYPSFPVLLPRFLKGFEQFNTYCGIEGLEPLKPNQWEVIYVNHLPRGDLWEKPEEWSAILPNASFPMTGFEGYEPEALSAQWHFVLHGNRGRLHVDLSFVRVGDEAGNEALKLKLVARGPIRDEMDFDLSAGLQLGHDTIVRSFDAMTSPMAHDYWKKRND